MRFATKEIYYILQQLESKANTSKLPVLFKRSSVSFTFISLIESQSKWSSYCIEDWFHLFIYQSKPHFNSNLHIQNMSERVGLKPAVMSLCWGKCVFPSWNHSDSTQAQALSNWFPLRQATALCKTAVPYLQFILSTLKPVILYLAVATSFISFLPRKVCQMGVSYIKLPCCAIETA